MTRLFNITILLLLAVGQSFAQTASVKPSTHTIQIIKKDIPSIAKYKYMYFMENPYQLINYWGNETLPINKYTAEELKFQRELNAREHGEFVKTKYVEQSYANNNYDLPIEERNIDNEPITPFTWKWVIFEIFHEDGGSDRVKVCRPNWWLKKYGADDLGNKMYLNMPENGIFGNAVVTSIIPNQLDTRIEKLKREGEYTYRPVIGTFKHQQGQAWEYYFSEGDPIGATPNHPFFSLDRNTYVPVGELKIGEKVKNSTGKEVVLLKKVKRPKPEPVYNLEIYRDHNFLVGEQGILVHNSCLLQLLTKYKSVQNRFNQLSSTLKTQFLRDFELATDDMMKLIDADVKFIDDWEKLKNINANTTDWLTEINAYPPEFYKFSAYDKAGVDGWYTIPKSLSEQVLYKEAFNLDLTGLNIALRDKKIIGQIAPNSIQTTTMKVIDNMKGDPRLSSWGNIINKYSYNKKLCNGSGVVISETEIHFLKDMTTGKTFDFKIKNR